MNSYLKAFLKEHPFFVGEKITIEQGDVAGSGVRFVASCNGFHGGGATEREALAELERAVYRGL